jgi:putative PIN family toxin of toxin-antitoxin system
MANLLSVVLDTNVLLSGLAYPNSTPGRIIAAWQHGVIDVVLSEFILDEVARVLPRLRARHGLTDQEIDDLVDIIRFQVELVEPEAITDPELRDQADQPVLATLVAAGKAFEIDYLITGDNDLLVLADRYPIISPAGFWQKHG